MPTRVGFLWWQNAFIVSDPRNKKYVDPSQGPVPQPNCRGKDRRGAPESTSRFKLEQNHRGQIKRLALTYALGPEGQALEFAQALGPEEELAEHKDCIRRCGFSSAEVILTDGKRAQLLCRAIGWPWNGYELKQLKEAGLNQVASTR